MYRNLLRESCPPQTALRRAAVLAKEAQAVKAYEQRTRSGPAAENLAIVQSDIAYEQASNTLGCWADTDPAFAQMHVRMARDGVTARLKELAKGGPALLPLGSAESLAPGRGAEFRALARILIQSVDPRCAIARAVDNDHILAPARAEVAGFRQRLRASPYDLQFAIAQADVDYEDSTVTVECADPSAAPVGDLTAEAIRETKRQIAGLTAIAGL